MVLKINSKDYKISVLRLVSLICKDIIGDSLIAINNILCDTMSINSSLRELFIALDDSLGLKSVALTSEELKIEIEKNDIKIYSDNIEMLEKIQDRVNNLKSCNGIQNIEVVRLLGKDLELRHLVDTLSKCGKLDDANSIHFSDGSVLHSMRYNIYSIVVYKDRIYIINYGFASEKDKKRVIKMIQDDIKCSEIDIEYYVV